MSTMQEETTPIFKRLWYDWTQQQPGIEPTNPLGQCWVPPNVAFYDQQGLLRTYSLPGGSIRSPHPGSSIRSPHPGPLRDTGWPNYVSWPLLHRESHARRDQLGIVLTKPLGHCWVTPILAFYDPQVLLRAYSPLGSSIRSPQPGPPRGVQQAEKIY